jgi:hypothetical protein
MSQFDARNLICRFDIRRRMKGLRSSMNRFFSHIRNLRRRRKWHQNGMMKRRRKPQMISLFCGLALCVAWAQMEAAESAPTHTSQHGKPATAKQRPLTRSDGLTVVATALHTKVRRSEHDCSHLVHGIYTRAGFPYTYADSDELYVGVQGFQRVNYPQPGDVIVWHGHAGIVVKPAKHLFFSFLSRGPGVDNYKSRYWTGRGSPRFYRYIKNDPCPGCALRGSLEDLQ